MEEKDKIINSEIETEKINAQIAQQADDEEEALSDKVKIVSPGRLVAKRFFRSRLSMIGLITLIVLFLFSFLGPVIYPEWEEVEVDYTTRYDPVVVVTQSQYQVQFDASEAFFISATGAVGDMKAEVRNTYDAEHDTYRLTIGSEVYTVKITLGANTSIFLCDEFGSIITYELSTRTEDFPRINTLAPAGVTEGVDENGNETTSFHVLGTDENGRDVFVRLMYGGRISLTLGFAVVLLQTLFGIILGGLAGYFGKWVDMVIMRVVDIFNCLPSFPILLIISAVLDGMEIDQKFRIYYLMMIMTLLGWSGVARMVRGQILYLREQEFMVAAEALGLSVPRKIFKHLIPNVMPQLIVQMTLGLGGIILTESTLSYLNIGIPPPYAAWGTMISVAQKPQILQFYPNLWVPAGILIVLAVLAFNFVGDGLRDAFDPKARR